MRVPSSTTMTVEKFVPVGTLDPIYFDASYYLVPDGDAGEDVYAVLRDAIAASGTVALTHVVIGRRERVVAIVPSCGKADRIKSLRLFACRRVTLPSRTGWESF